MKFTLKEDIEVIEQQPVDEKVVQASLAQMINDTINAEWEAINRIKSDIVTLEAEAPDQTEVKTILEAILDEKIIHIGMLTKAQSLLDGETQELMNAGVEKAEEVISEPASQDLE